MNNKTENGSLIYTSFDDKNLTFRFCIVEPDGQYSWSGKCSTLFELLSRGDMFDRLIGNAVCIMKLEDEIAKKLASLSTFCGTGIIFETVLEPDDRVEVTSTCVKVQMTLNHDNVHHLLK